MRLLAGSQTIPVLDATITWTQRGPWVADPILDATAAPTGAVTLEEGSVRLRGTVISSGAWAGRATARIVAGAGKLGRRMVARQYRGATLALVLSDIGTDSGELVQATTVAVGGTILQATTGGQKAGWARPAVGPARALDDLVAALGADFGWRATDAGKFLIGPETWPTVSPRKAKVIDEDTATGILTVDDELLELRPGTTWEGRRITAVQVQWSSQRTRTRVWVLREEKRSLGEALARAVEARLPSVVWTRLHPSTVHSQDPSDLSVQVFPDQDDVPPMVSVPLRTGIPGLAVRVLQGARVLLAFEEGDPRRPIALPAFDEAPDKLAGLDITATTEVNVDAPHVRLCRDGGEVDLGDTPANPVARVGDIVQVSLALVVPDPLKGVTLSSPVGPVTGTIGTPPLPVIAVGQILSGKNNVLG